MSRDPDVYDHEWLHSMNGGLFMCQERIVDEVCMKGTDTLEKWIQGLREGIASQKAAQYADILLADFVRHSVLDGFREVEAPMRAAYEPFVKAHQKRKDARLATEEETHAWEVLAEDFRTKLKVLGEWAASAARARDIQLWKVENPVAYMTVVGTSSMLSNPGNFVKYHDALFREINFIRAISEEECIEGRWERPVWMSDFESSLKALEAAQARVKARQDEKADAEVALDSAQLRYREEQHKAIAVLRPLSEAGRWALFRLVSDSDS